MSATSTRPSERHTPPVGAGIGLRLPHLLEVAATRPPIGWMEVHPENFLANPHAREVLQEIATGCPIALHTVGVSVGSASGVDRRHLARVAELADELQPCLVSGHLAWSTHDGAYLNDLLPLPYTAQSLARIAAHVHEVQDALGRPFVLENPASYVGFSGSTMPEPEFLNRLADATGCQLLCDVSNIVLSASNLGFDAMQYIAELEPAHVAELHLGGFEEEVDDAVSGDRVLIDTHGCFVADASWSLLEHVLARFGTRPTLIEWDNDVPPLATLLAEAARAQSCLDRVREPAHAAG